MLFDVESGELLQRLEGHYGDVNDVVFHPSGEWFATGGDDGQIIRWSVPLPGGSAEHLAAWDGPDKVWSLAVSPDGSLLGSGGTDNDISLWDVATGELEDRLVGHTDAIAPHAGLAFSPSGELLASASYDNTARLWDVATGINLHVFGDQTEEVDSVAFTPDGRQVATSIGGRRIVLWEVSSGQAVQVFEGHENRVSGLALIPRDPGTEKIDVYPGTEVPLLVSVSGDRTLRVWDTDRGVTLRVLQGHTAGALGVAVHTSIAPGSGVPHQRLVDLPAGANSAAIAPDGERVAVGFSDGSIRLYSLPAGRLLGETSSAHGDAINRLAFNRDGNLLASASHDDTAKLWDVTENQTLTAARRTRVMKPRSTASPSPPMDAPSPRRVTTVGWVCSRWVRTHSLGSSKPTRAGSRRLHSMRAARSC